MISTMGIGANDVVITVSNTAVPTCTAIAMTGAEPVFVDIDEYSLMDVSKIEEEITDKTKAILPVHLFGQMCDMDSIQKIAKKNKIVIIEDCAQSQGAKFKNKFSGTFGKFGCFSFLSY